MLSNGYTEPTVELEKEELIGYTPTFFDFERPCKGLQMTGEDFILCFIDFLFFDLGLTVGGGGTRSTLSFFSSVTSISGFPCRTSLSTLSGSISVSIESKEASWYSSSKLEGNSSPIDGSFLDSCLSSLCHSSDARLEENLSVYEHLPLQPLEISSIVFSSWPFLMQQLLIHSMPLGSSCFLYHTMKDSEEFVYKVS